MNYLVRRGDEQFGPYSLSDLQRYVQSGQILHEDLAQSEGMTEWMTVGQVLGTIPIPPTQPVGSIPVYENSALPARVSLPANLPWWILLILGIVTRQLFNMIWAFVLANWARKLSGTNTALVLIAMYPAGMISGFIAIAAGTQGSSALTSIGWLLLLAGAIVYVVGVFSIKSAMEDYYTSTENIGMSLSGVMTFFFGIIYLQYHVNDLARSKKSGLSLA